jgi:large subunit ribosomal protein L4
MKAQVLNEKGEKTGLREIFKALEREPNPFVVHRAYKSALANSRLPWAHTKNRGEVRGGGAKPWRQKGTGNARHGSLRSPLFRGGGVVFGPRSTRNYFQKINKKERQNAVLSCLTNFAKEGKLYLLPEIDFKKTKEVAKLLASLDKKAKKLAIVSSNISRLFENIPQVKVVSARQLGLLELTWADLLFVDEEGARSLEEMFGKKPKKLEEK